MCSHQALSTFYDDPADEKHRKIEFVQDVGCSCNICSQGNNITKVDISQEMYTMLCGLRDLAQEHEKITMRQFVQYAMQSSAAWLSEKPSVVSQDSFGFARTWKDVSVDRVENLIRIGICVGVIHLDFDFITLDKDILRCFRHLSLSEEGQEIVDAENPIKDFIVPDPFHPTNNFDSGEKRKKRKKSLSHFGWPQVKELLSKPCEWLTIQDPQQFRALGIGIDTFPFLYYVEDWKCLKDASHREFMQEDLQLTKGSGRSLKNATYTVTVKSVDVPLVVKLNPCLGCKKCPAQDCEMAFNNYAKHNNCPRHKDEYKHVINVGEDCPVTFAYVYPVDTEDRRQWLGCVTKAAGHNHPSPVDWKWKSKTKQDLSMAKSTNPLGKPKDFQKGLGFTYEPMLADPAASHTGRFNREVSKTASTSAKSRKFVTMEIVSQFYQIVEEVDGKTNPEQADEEVKEKLNDMMANYATQDHCVMIGDRLFVCFASKWQSQIFSSATHLFMDICYVKNEELPVLFNVVAPCGELKRYITVYRAFVNKQDGPAIAYVINTMFKEVQLRHPDFNNGENLKQIMVDFSDAEENGLCEALGDGMVNKVLRGCEFHFMQSVNKVANLVTQTECQRNLFMAIAKRIQSATDKDEVYKSFEVLGGLAPTSEIKEYFTDVRLKETAELVNNESWKGASTWIDWWLRPRHLAKLSMAFSGISQDDWMSSQGTNNPVESINRISKPRTLCSIKDSLRHVYYEDRRFAFMLIAVRAGQSITYRQSGSKKPRKRKQTGMGNPYNPPDKRAKARKVPRGDKAVNHRVEVEYYDDSGTQTRWYRGRIIMYSRTRGYLVSFDDLGPEENVWEKKITDPDFRFID